MRALKAIVAATVLLCAFAWSMPALAYGPHGGGHFRGGVAVGVLVGAGLGLGYYGYPYYYNPYYYNPYYYNPYYYNPYYGAAQVVMPAAPTAYVEQSYAQPAPSQGGNYWYYCSDPQGYYPYVQQCRVGWQRVSPTPPSVPR
jgi:hypothetical protein